MPGKSISQQQVKLYMSKRNTGHSQVSSAAQSGLSERTARRIEQGGHRPKVDSPRLWRTREDPFTQVWEQELEPRLKESPALMPITLLEYLQDKHPGHYPDSLLRTLQRRVKQWRGCHGEAQELIFRQTQVPGRLGFSDFTKLKGLIITIQGAPLKHLLYHFRLAYSGWSYAKIILGGESYTALTEGLQEALWRLGGSPHEHRTDSLSAAFKNLSKQEEGDLTQNYEEFCLHYGMKPSRNNRGIGHENGSIESPHGHLKRRIGQSILLRRSNDFEDVESYQEWLDEIIKRNNQRNAKNITLEREKLQSLPVYKTVDFTELMVLVHSTGTIEVRKTTYTVPSRLRGERLRVHLYDDKLRCFLGSHLVIELPRIYSIGKDVRARLVDYRHLIDSLVRKPQSFRFSQIREDILPNPIYKTIWKFLDRKLEGRASCKLMVGILFLAAKFDCEKEMGEKIISTISLENIPNIEELKRQFGRQAIIHDGLSIKQHTLHSYDDLLNGGEPHA
jgi:transposase InsO family protein